MTATCWTVPVRINPFTGKTESAYVRADDEAGAVAEAKRRTGKDAIGAPTVTFPWIQDLALPAEDAPIADDQQGQNEHGQPHPMAGAVMKWLRAYTGRNEFVLDVKSRVETGAQFNGRNAGARKRVRLSRKQIEALLKVMEREAQWAEERANPKADTGPDIRAAVPVGTIYAAALNSEGAVSFVRIDRVERGKWDGWVFVKAVIGPNEERLGAARPGQNYSGQWESIIRDIVADVDAAVALYGKTIGRCGVCNRQLTNEESREYGIGPECRAKLGGLTGA